MAKLKVFVFFILLLLQKNISAAKREIGISSPSDGLLALPVMAMIHNNQFDPYDITVKFIPWNNQEQLRAIILRGDADFIGMPVIGAALLSSKGVPLSLVGVSLGNVLNIITTDNNIKELHDLKGLTVAVPLKDELPDIFFQLLLGNTQGISLEDIKFRYVASSKDSANLLSGEKVQAALIAEPHASILLKRSGTDGLPIFYRNIEMDNYVSSLTKDGGPFPSAGIIASSKASSDFKLIKIFWHEYIKAYEWCYSNPRQASALLKDQGHTDKTREGIADAVNLSFIKPIKGVAARENILLLLKRLGEVSPSSYGSITPDESFFLDEKESY